MHKHTSQDYNRKHGKDHIAENPRTVKDLPTEEDDESSDSGAERKHPHNAEFLSNQQAAAEKSETHNFPKQDERKLVRQEHTNHFTNRASTKNNS